MCGVVVAAVVIVVAACLESKMKKHQSGQLSKNMEYILQQEAVHRGIDQSLLKSNEFSHIIIKTVQDDEKMYLVAMMKRIQQCCPFQEEEQDKEAEAPKAP